MKKEKRFLKQKRFSAATFCRDLELTGQDSKDITKRLNNRLGDKNSNMSVPANGTIPFMVVFSDLPDNLAEYTVEAAGSIAK